jgi:hypothetical protein
MSTPRLVFGLVLLALAAGRAALAQGDKDKVAEPPKEESVAPYDSKTVGALQVKSVSDTGDWCNVYRGDKRVAGDRLLGATIELAPGAYRVIVNKTERKVTIEAGRKTTLWTGELFVEGKKGSGDFWAPFQGKDRKLSRTEPLVNTGLPLFAGKYAVKVLSVKQADLGEAEVKAGQRTVVKQ